VQNVLGNPHIWGITQIVTILYGALVVAPAGICSVVPAAFADAAASIPTRKAEGNRAA